MKKVSVLCNQLSMIHIFLFPAVLPKECKPSLSLLRRNIIAEVNPLKNAFHNQTQTALNPLADCPCISSFHYK
jgi:hypothetical protein